MTTKLDGTNGIIFPDNSSQASATYLTFRNRIINGDMRIDQRNNGAAMTATTAGPAATVDRMLIYPVGANVTAQRVAGTGAYQYDLLLTGASGNTETQLRYKMESVHCDDLKNQQVTVQAQVARSISGTITWYAYYANSVDNFGTSTQITTGTFTATSAQTIYNFSFNAGTNAGNGLMLILSFGALGAGVTARVSGLQLEAGTTVTPFERVEYSEMLRRCCRYTVTVTCLYSDLVASTGTRYAGFSHQEMRVTPTLLSNTTVEAETNVASVALGVNTANGGRMNVTPTASGAVFAHRKLILTAEL